MQVSSSTLSSPSVVDTTARSNNKSNTWKVYVLAIAVFAAVVTLPFVASGSALTLMIGYAVLIVSSAILFDFLLCHKNKQTPISASSSHHALPENPSGLSESVVEPEEVEPVEPIVSPPIASEELNSQPASLDAPSPVKPAASSIPVPTTPLIGEQGRTQSAPILFNKSSKNTPGKIAIPSIFTNWQPTAKPPSFSPSRIVLPLPQVVFTAISHSSNEEKVEKVEAEEKAEKTKTVEKAVEVLPEDPIKSMLLTKLNASCGEMFTKWFSTLLSRCDVAKWNYHPHTDTFIMEQNVSGRKKALKATIFSSETGTPGKRQLMISTLLLTDHTIEMVFKNLPNGVCIYLTGVNISHGTQIFTAKDIGSEKQIDHDFSSKVKLKAIIFNSEDKNITFIRSSVLGSSEKFNTIKDHVTANTFRKTKEASFAHKLLKKQGAELALKGWTLSADALHFTFTPSSKNPSLPSLE